MKKVLKLILVLAVISALCVSVFAASPTTKEINTNGSGIVAKATTDASDDWEVYVGPVLDPAGIDANMAVIGVTAGKDVLESFDVIVKYKGEVVHSGISVTITLSGLTPYIGQTLTLYEYDGSGVSTPYTATITGDTMTFVLTHYSTFTPVVTKGAAQGATSPRTNQTVVPTILTAIALLAFAGVLFANKQRRAA